MADAAEWQTEFRCRRRDGGAVTVALRAVPLRSPAGAVTGHIAAVEDVSLRSRLYAKLTALIETSRILLDTPRLDAVLPGRGAGGEEPDRRGRLRALAAA